MRASRSLLLGLSQEVGEGSQRSELIRLRYLCLTGVRWGVGGTAGASGGGRCGDVSVAGRVEVHQRALCLAIHDGDDTLGDVVPPEL